MNNKKPTGPYPIVNITNKLNLPRPFVLAVASDDSYNAGNSWRTVTELIDPPQMVFLKRKHESEIVEDAADLVYTFQGHVIHAVIEKAARTLEYEGWEAERRIFKEIRGCLISGQFDLYHESSGELLDVKYSTAWKAKKGKCPEEWENQLNCLAALLRSEGKTVNAVWIMLIIRDHSKLEAARDPDYPQKPVVMLQANLWGEEEAMLYLEDRVRLHQLAELKEPMPCSPAERWARPDVWAIKKRGSTRAIPGGLYADKNAAINTLGFLPGHEIEHRKGEYMRCRYYCQAAPFCEQNKSEKC